MTRCIDCGRPIGQMCLRAVPSATRCSEHQEAADYRDNLAGRGPLRRALTRAEAALAVMGEIDGDFTARWWGGSR
jgi:RNA polymerase-binding transcription factor DksA